MACGIALGILILAPGLSVRADTVTALAETESQRIELVKQLSPQVVSIFSPGGKDGGSGVLISADGLALTNFHVVAGSTPALKCGLADGNVYDAVIVGIDATGDVALIKLLGRDDFPVAALGDSDRVRVGDWVMAMGNPFLLATDFNPTVTLGLISGIHRYQYPSGTLLEYADCLQTDASINPGNSGGPLFALDGSLIGINGRCSFEKRGRVNVGVAYSISINQIKNFLSVLASGRLADHAALGAIVDSDLNGRVIVSDILESSDAYRRGLRLGDEIVRFADSPIRSVNAFKNALGTLPEGWRVPLVFRRRGELHEISVRLASLHQPGELAARVQVAPRAPSPLPEGAPEAPHAPAEASAVPEQVAQQFIVRPGFVNYYFNQQHQDRVAAACRARGDFSALRNSWAVSGKLPNGGRADFELDDQQCTVKLPLGHFDLTVSDDLSGETDPPGSGGLLTALWVWRRWLIDGPAGFDQCQYLGQMPLVWDAPWCEAVEVLVGGTRSRIYFDATEGWISAIELWREADADPCEVRFTNYRPQQDQQFASRIEVRHGDVEYGVVDDLTLQVLAPQTED
jgi:S1-C subfamily serine protease